MRSRLRRVACVLVLVAARPNPSEAQRLVGISGQERTTGGSPSPAQGPPSGQSRVSTDLQTDGVRTWTPTEIVLEPGERLIVAADGSLRCPGQDADTGPNGLARGYRDLLRSLPVNNAGRGALIGRIGDDGVAQPFLIGASRDIVTAAGGRLTVGINQTDGPACIGTYAIHLDVYPPTDGRPEVVAREREDLQGIDQALFKRIPRRIGDQHGNPGDMVNFLILASEAAMRRTFATAGWVKVDADVKSAFIAGVIDSLSKESYVTMPMSPLFLFGRSQDYGWAHAEPVKVVASRHHSRIWKAPFDVDGTTLWVGAATHDIGFERDRRNNGITHKIDPEIDLERDYVRKTFVGTGLVSEFGHFLPDNPLKEAKTATGGSFRSDGRVLILRLPD